MQIVVYCLPAQETETHEIVVESGHLSAFAQAQEADESLKHVRRWIKQNINAKKSDFQELPRLGWQTYNQMSSLYLKDRFHCRNFEPNDGRAAYLQMIFLHLWSLKLSLPLTIL